MSNSTTFRADLLYNGVWNNITSDVYTKEQVVIKRGRADESASPEASTLDITLNNRTGKYSPLNPAGALYGLIGRQTGIRVGMGTPPAGMGENAANTNFSSFVAPGVTAETAGVAMTYWCQHATGNTFTPPAGYTALTARTGIYSTSIGVSKTVAAGFVAGPTCSSTASAPWAAVSMVVPGASASVITSASTGTGGNGNSLNPAANQNQIGPFSLQVGDVIVVANAWSGDFGNNMSVAPQDNTGGCSWVQVADSGAYPGPSSQPRILVWAFYSDSVQTVTVTIPNHYYFIDDNHAAAWQIRGAAEWNPRYQGQCATFDTTADLSENDVRTAVEAGSVLRQRGQGQEAPRSAQYRYLSNSQANAYWPLEGQVANAITSPIAGCPQAGIVGPAASFASQAMPGSDPILTLAANSYFATTVPANTSNSATNVQGAVSCIFQIDTAPTGSPSFLGIWCNGASGNFITLQYVAGSAHWNLVVYHADGTTLLATAVSMFLPSGVSTYLGRPIACTISWAPNIANPTTQTDFEVCITDMLTPGSQAFSTVTANAFTIGTINSIFFGTTPFPQTFFNVPVSVGHISATYSARIDGSTIILNDIFQTGAAYSGIGTGWNAEDLMVRMTRLCQEQGILFQSRPETLQTSAITMGAQLTNDTISLLEEVQETDGEGELYEARGFTGLTYRSVGEISGGASQATFDFNAKQVTSPFNQVDDDQLSRNSITVQQNGGSAQLVEQTTGPMSTSPPPVGIGLFTGNPTVNVSNQARDLQQLGNWFVHVGTTQAPRYPSVTSELSASPSTISASSSIDCGQRITLANPPTWGPPGPIDLVVLGTNETISPVPSASWKIVMNCRPYAPFATVVLASATTQPAPTATLDSGSSTLTSGITNSQTSISVSTSLTHDLWTTTNTPFAILVDGEEMSVTAVSGSTSPQTFTVTRSVNGIVKAHLAAAPVHAYFADFVGLQGV